MEINQILGHVATFLFTIMYVPQIWKTFKNQSIKDVSISMFVIGLIANIIALVYSTLIHQPPLQIKYFIALIVLGFYLIIYFKIKGSGK